MGDNTDPTPMLDTFSPALRHYVHELLGCEEGDILVEAIHLTGLTELDQLLYLGDTFDQATLTMPTGTRSRGPSVIPRHLISKINWSLKHIVNHLANSGDLYDDDHWLKMDKQTFKLMIAQLAMRSTAGNPGSTTTTPTTTTVTSSPYTPAQSFKKGIRRDPSAFPVLKQQKYYQSWKRTFVGQAHAQDVANVVAKPLYQPPDAQAAELFALQQDFMYAVFQNTLLTDKGKEIVREHTADRDAQTVFEKLETHASLSTEATIEIQKLVTFLTTTRLDSSWKGTFSGFITHWKQQLMNYEDMTDASEHYTSEVKKRMLMTALELVRDLRDLQLADERQRATDPNHKPLSYDQYCALLDSATSRLDDIQVKTSRYQSRKPVSSRAHAMQYQSNAHDYSYFDDGDLFWGDVEPPDSELDIYRAQQISGPKQSKPWVPREVWTEIMRHPDLLALWRNADWNQAPGNNKLASAKPPQRIKANLHDHVYGEDLDADAAAHGETEQEPPPDEPEPSPLLAHVTQRKQLPSSDIQEIIRQSHKPKSRGNPAPTPSAPRKPPAKATPKQINMLEMDGKFFIEFDGPNVSINMHNVQYEVSMGDLTRIVASLLDRGANGGLAGADCRLLEQCTPMRYADVTGAGDKKIHKLPIGNYAGLTVTNKGPVILIMNQYAGFHKGKTIHSAGQWEHHGIKVDDRSKKVGGTQRIITVEGYVLPLQIRQGLPVLDMRPPTDEEMEKYPHVIVTADTEWDPTVLDCEQAVHDVVDHDVDPKPHGATYPFDAQGNYTRREVYLVDIGDGDYAEMELSSFVDQCVFAARTGMSTELPAPPASDLPDSTPHLVPPDPPDPLELEALADPLLETRAGGIHVRGKALDINNLKPYFLWLPHDVIQETIRRTTQYGRMTPDPTPLKVKYKSQSPAVNIRRRNEPVSSDVVYSDTPAVDNGSTAAVLFFGTKTMVTTGHGIKSDAQFVDAFEDEIRERGAMDKLITDGAQYEKSSRVKDILRALFIGAWQSKPYHEHQNPVERRYQTVKGLVNLVLNKSGAPAELWLLCLLWVLYILNRCSCSAINGDIPMTRLTGQTVDISNMFQFSFYDKVYFATGRKLSYSNKPKFPSEAEYRTGHFVGFSENVGDTMTFQILTDDTHKIHHCSNVWPAVTPDARVPFASDDGEEDPPENLQREVLKSPARHPFQDAGQFVDGCNAQGSDFKTFTPDELLNRTYLTPKDDQDQRFRARIVEKLRDKQYGDVLTTRDAPETVQFRVTYDHPNRDDEIIAYNDIVDHIEQQMEADKDPDSVLWQFEEIVAHQGPLRSDHPHYMGSAYNVKILWSDGSETYEPLHVIAADNPVTCALYAKKAGLLDTPGWKRFAKIARREKKLIRLVNQAKLRSKRTAKKYQYGYQVPSNPNEAIQLDREAKNTKWQDSMALEMSQLLDYQTFIDKGYKGAPPPGHKRIRAHWVYAIKHDGRFKSRLVAGGHLTDTPTEDVYSGVVSVRSLRMVIFLAELNGLEVWGADIGNAYLEAKTQEKLYIVGDAGFGDLCGHTLVIYKALYGLRSSGKRWHERFFDVLREQGFKLSKADNDVWMRDMGDHYEYIAVYVDDLAIASKDPAALIRILKEEYKFKIKGDGAISFHLGCDYFREPDGTLVAQPKKYIEKMMSSFNQMFNELPKKVYKAPLEPNDHPELDESQPVGEDDRAKYLCMVGQLQWLVTLGRWDVMSATVTMSRFRAEPRVGHLERCKRIYGYLRVFNKGATRYRTGYVDHSDLPTATYDWMRTVYGDIREVIPSDAPVPRGPRVSTTTYVDANLYHDWITGRALTGVLHLLNGTPIEWFCKRQSTVETATYGSEFVAARIATEQIIDLRHTLRYLGVNIDGPSTMFGDNQSVVTSSTIPSSVLNKRSSALNYHRVREAIACGVLNFHHIKGKANPSDVLSKHYAHKDVWPMLEPVMFWKGTGPPQDVLDMLQDKSELRSKGEYQESNKIDPANTTKKSRRVWLAPTTV